jgi:hypothetical protein
LADSAMYQVSESSIAINQNAVTTAAPEALYVWQPSTSSYNVISGKGNLDTYLQLNIQNVNQGVSASSDVVATANNGNETTNYIDMGINSENFSGFLGGPNDAYIYATGNEFHIGNATAGKHLGFFVGGGNVDTDNKFALYPTNQHQMTGSLDVSGSVKAFSFTGSLSGTASFANNATSASYARNATSASYALSASYAENATSASYALSASYSNVATSASYSSTATSASYAVTASSADNFLVRGTLTAQTINVQTITSSVEFVTGSTKSGTIVTNTHQFTGSVTISGSLAVNNSNVILTNQTSSMSVATASFVQNAQTASFVLNAQTASFVQNAQTASYVLNAVSASYAANADLLDGKDSTIFATTGSNVFRGNQIVTGSLFTSGSNTLVGTTTLTGSLLVSGSTTQVGNNNLFGNTTLSGSIVISGSITGSYNLSVGGVFRLDPAQDPGVINATASFLFTSASNTETGFDLYYRQKNNLVKFKWLEGGISTGILYGGGISYSGSTIFVKPGSGIINNNNANTGSEISPVFTYVNWGPYTASAQYLTSSQNTYLYVDASGSIFQQTSFFNQTQYEQALPLGRVTHPNFVSITGYGSNVQTTYDSDTQQNDFIRAFGPIKVSGFSINAHTGSLGLGIGDGIAYNLGGFYTQDPNSPSHYESAGFATASIARAWRSGSGVYLDNNGGTFYNTVDSNYWDDGTGTLNTMSAGDWQIQRVFANPVTGRVVVYYGQNTYTTLLNALQYLATDSFTEGEFTAKSLVFVGYLVLKGQTTNLTDVVNNRIINAGIFRNIAGGSAGGGAVAQRLENLSDVIITSPSNGQALIYDGGNWINGIPTSASFASTASFVQNAQTASFVQTAQTASYWSGSILNAVSASYAASASVAVSASYATSSAYAANANIATYAGNIALLRDTTDTTLYPVFSAGTAADAYTSLRGNPSGALSYNATNFVLTLTSGSIVAPSFTGSLSGTASFANNATSASYAANATSASYANNATTSSYANVATSASYADNATSASHALTSSYSNNILGVANYIPKFTGDNSLSSSIIYENASGIGINDISPTHKLQVSGDAFVYNSNSTLNSTKYAFLPALNVTTTGTETNQWANVGIYGSLGYSATTGTFTPRDNSFLSTFLGNVIKSGGASVSGKMSSYAAAANFSGAGNVTTVAGFRAYAPLQSFALPAFSGTVTNYIGLLIDDINGTTDIGSQITNRYGIFQSGSLDRNYFAGATTFDGGITGSLLGTATTASYVLNAVSASNAATASYSQNLTVGSTLIVDQTLTDYATVASSIVGSNNVFTQNTSSYTSAFFKYTVSNGGSTRAGEVIAAWNGTTTEFTDFSTVDIGNTSAVTASISILSGQVQFNVQTNTSGWRIKSLATFM